MNFVYCIKVNFEFYLFMFDTYFKLKNILEFILEKIITLIFFVSMIIWRNDTDIIIKLRQTLR